MSVRNRILAIIALAAMTMTGLAACSDEEPFIPPVEDLGPNHPDKLMQHFQTIYEAMDFTELARMLAPTYLTILQQSTIAEFPDVGPTLDLAEELRIHERMFSKQDVTDPLGLLVPGIHTVQFQTFQRQGSWESSPASDPIPNAECATYDVDFLFDRGPAYSTLRVRGSIKFYVTHRDSMVNGVTTPYYKMLGQMDLTQDQKNIGAGDKNVAGATWGSLKVLFR